MKLKKFIFTICLSGYGNNSDEAWIDAANCTFLEDSDTPKHYKEIEIESDEDEYS